MTKKTSVDSNSPIESISPEPQKIIQGGLIDIENHYQNSQ
jgi:hypothetical protein